MITPEQLAACGTEDGHQSALFCWIALNPQYPDLRWLFAIPNGGLRDKITANKLKTTGVKSGVPDLCLPVRRGQFSALWIELKIPKRKAKHGGKGGVSDNQNEWKAYLLSQGFGVYVAYGWEDARECLINYLEWK